MHSHCHIKMFAQVAKIIYFQKHMFNVLNDKPKKLYSEDYLHPHQYSFQSQNPFFFQLLWDSFQEKCWNAQNISCKKMYFLSEISWESSLLAWYGNFLCENLWEESFLGITLPCHRDKERKKEVKGLRRACFQLESLTSTSWDISWIGWTSDLDGSLGFG